MSKKGNFLLGAGIGVGLGLLFAPKKGKETREELGKLLKDLTEKVKEIDVAEVKNAIVVKVSELETTIKDLDKETAKQMIIDKSKEVKIKAQELVDLAIEKGTPVVEKTAKKIKNKTAELLKNTAQKLDAENEQLPDDKKKQKRK